MVGLTSQRSHAPTSTLRSCVRADGEAARAMDGTVTIAAPGHEVGHDHLVLRALARALVAGEVAAAVSCCPPLGQTATRLLRISRSGACMQSIAGIFFRKRYRPRSHRCVVHVPIHPLQPLLSPGQGRV